MTIYKHVFKQKNNVFPTLSVSAVAHFYSFSTVHIKDQKKQASMIRKYHNHTLQTKTRPDIIMAFYKTMESIPFRTQIVCSKMCVPNSVVEHMSGFDVCCVQTTHYEWKVPSYLWVM